MSAIVYTPEYWHRAYKLVDMQMHHCEYCNRPHDERKGEFYCFVRVIDIGPVHGDYRNLVLACSRCRPNPRGPKLSKKQILDKIAELPFPSAEPVKSAHA